MSSPSVLGATPVVLTSDDECLVAVDGEDKGTIAAGGVLRIEMVPGEHFLSAVCAGDRRWKDTVEVGDLQRVVTIPSGAAPLATAGSADSPPSDSPPGSAPEVLGWSGCPLVKSTVGEWVIFAVIHGTACHAASFRPGDTVLSIAGHQAAEITREILPRLDSGPLGTTVEWVIRGRGEVRTVVLTRTEVPPTGTVVVLQPDGHSTRSSAYDGQGSLWGILDSFGQQPGTESASVCTGTAMPCWQRASGICRLGQGCLEGGSCSGFATATCLGKPQLTCGMTPGCFWQVWSKSCGGTGPTCFGQASSFACNAIPGCSWRHSCLGTATACSALDHDICSFQPGCTLR